MASPLQDQVTSLASARAALDTDPSSAPDWQAAEVAARTIADSLRGSDAALKDQLGESSLPTSLAGLLNTASSTAGEAGIPSSTDAKGAVYEVLRVGANVCSDHDPNRQSLLDSGAVASVLALLNAYWQRISTTDSSHLPLEDLRLIKTCIGVLLNASLSYEPVRTTLISSKAPLTILKLSSTLYPPGGWADGDAEEWKWRSGLSNWAWHAISSFKRDDAEEDGPTTQNQAKQPAVFDAEALPSLISSLREFIPKVPPQEPKAFYPKTSQDLVRADLEVLNHVSMELESLALDSQSVRRQLASSDVMPILLDFVEKSGPPAYWQSFSTPKERQSWDKKVGLCKAAVIKAVVEVAGEKDSLAILWDDKATGSPGGEFVKRMVDWIKETKLDSEDARDDLVICATLSLGNMARDESHSTPLLTPPYSLLPHLLPLLEPKVDLKVKHGCTGLLKHLAQSPQNKALLGAAGTIEALAASGIWRRESDIAEIVQINAIGVAKHLSYLNATNALRLTAPIPNDPENDSPLDLILDLAQRSDELTVQSEGTRVLVNVVKGLFALQQAGLNGLQSAAPEGAKKPIAPPEESPVDEDKRKEAIARLLTLDTTEALCEMLARSGRYPILLNEAVVSLTLLSTQPPALPLVLQSLLTTLPYRITESGQAVAPPSGTNGQALTSRNSSPLDMIVAILRNLTKVYPLGLIANACTLLGTLGKDTSEDAEKIRQATKPALEALVPKAMEVDGEAVGPKAKNIVEVAAKKTLEAWSAKP
ncbi:hypothetical protein FRB90_010326 [Tulasnella sp. 427]|nr:hypothetical protein FRB90_010326 [Tulasnella sp. 427]